jgi:hypothetical protein
LSRHHSQEGWITDFSLILIALLTFVSYSTLMSCPSPALLHLSPKSFFFFLLSVHLF